MGGLFYLLRSGLPWRMLSKEFPPVWTVQRYFYAWRDSGFWKTINHLLLILVRHAACEAYPFGQGRSGGFSTLIA